MPSGKFQAMIVEQRGAQIPGDPDAEKTHGKNPGHHGYRVQLLAGQQGVGGDGRDQPARNDRRGCRGDGLVDVALVQGPRRLTAVASCQALPNAETHQQRDDRHVERPADLEARVDIGWGQQDAQHGAGQHCTQAQFALDADGGSGRGCVAAHWQILFKTSGRGLNN
jgi:hypothetical protein